MSDAVRGARRAAVAWASRSVVERARLARAMRFAIAERAEYLADAALTPQKGFAQTLASEVVPLADACRFLELEAARLLETRVVGRRGRPLWLSGTEVAIAREPWGVVLVIAPSNYPLFLPGVHAVQALVAGNAVVVKPGPGGKRALREFAEALSVAGLPPGLLTILEEDPGEALAALDEGVDHVVVTGSATTGRAVLSALAERIVPATLELSGADAAFVLSDAEPTFAARALVFGLCWNGGATCIAPRRVFVARPRLEALEGALRAELDRRAPVAIDPSRATCGGAVVREALRAGARVVAGGVDDRGALCGPTVLADVDPQSRAASGDVFAPVAVVVPFDDLAEAEATARRCPYALGASVFGPPSQARALAGRLPVGVVVVNDVIVPTADPRVPFGGRGESGYGTTRGADGLLAMTRPKAVVSRSGTFRPHFEPPVPGDERIFLGTLRAAHARTAVGRLRAAASVIRAMAHRGRT